MLKNQVPPQTKKRIQLSSILPNNLKCQTPKKNKPHQAPKITRVPSHTPKRLQYYYHPKYTITECTPQQATRTIPSQEKENWGGTPNQVFSIPLTSMHQTKLLKKVAPQKHRKPTAPKQPIKGYLWRRSRQKIIARETPRRIEVQILTPLLPRNACWFWTPWSNHNH